MTDPTYEKNELSTLRWMLTIVAALSVAGSGVGVWLGYTARQENCENTHDAFNGAFQTLGEELGADQERIDRFLVKLNPVLEDCA